MNSKNIIIGIVAIVVFLLLWNPVIAPILSFIWGFVGPIIGYFIVGSLFVISIMASMQYLPAPANIIIAAILVFILVFFILIPAGIHLIIYLAIPAALYSIYWYFTKK